MKIIWPHLTLMNTCIYLHIFTLFIYLQWTKSWIRVGYHGVPKCSCEHNETTLSSSNWCSRAHKFRHWHLNSDKPTIVVAFCFNQWFEIRKSLLHASACATSYNAILIILSRCNIVTITIYIFHLSSLQLSSNLQNQCSFTWW